MDQRPTIALLTDFGLSDAYVGSMKGVILSLCPSAHLIDLTHAIPPQAIHQAAYVLLTAYRHFPAHTVFLIVVDPGVGTARAPIAVATDQGIYVAPDNGVLSYVLPRVTIRNSVRLQNPGYHLSEVSSTFHGRDIFSPAAAHLAQGVPLELLGPAQPNLHRLADPILKITPPYIHGEVLHSDHFGNIITSIGHLAWCNANMLQLTPQFGSEHPPLPLWDATRCQITIGAHTLHQIRSAYGNVLPGTLTALIGSSGQLEIGMNQGHAARTLVVSMGDPVTVMLDAHTQ